MLNLIAKIDWAKVGKSVGVGIVVGTVNAFVYDRLIAENAAERGARKALGLRAEGNEPRRSRCKRRS